MVILQRSFLVPLKAFLFGAVCVYVCTVSVCDNILKVYEHDLLQTACENFTKFMTSVGAVADKDELT